MCPVWCNGEKKAQKGTFLVAFLVSPALMVLQNSYSASAICYQAMIYKSRTGVDLSGFEFYQELERGRREGDLRTFAFF